MSWKEFSKIVLMFKIFKLLYLCGEMKSSDVLKVMRKGFDIVNGIGFFLFKTWHLIVTEAPVQMPLLFYRPMCA